MIRIVLNGIPVELSTDPDEMLVDVLRREQLFGSRESCGQGVCGACTVLVDRRAVASCILFAQLVDGSEIETIEGIGLPGSLSAVQEAFIQERGFQCGFCTPGIIVSVTQLLRENPDPTDEDISLYLAGHICRCGAYPEILRAVRRSIAATHVDEDDGVHARSQ